MGVHVIKATSITTQNRKETKIMRKRLTTLALVGTMAASSIVPAFAATSTPVQSRSAYSSNYGNYGDMYKKWYEEWQKYWQNNANNTKLATPTVTEAKFTHASEVYWSHNTLSINWDAIEGATSYDVEITGYDGTVTNYTVTENKLYMQDIDCPKTFNEKTRTWGATVKVRAVANGKTSDWSEECGISCNVLHFGMEKKN